MRLLLGALGVQLLCGLCSIALRTSGRWATVAGVGGIVAGSVLGLVPTVSVLLGAAPLTLHLPWSVPFGAFTLGLDALSALFLLPVFGLSAVAAVFGGAYLRGHEGRQSAGASWFFFALLVVSMALVLVARNAVLFLVAWEIMAVASFFLVTADDAEPDVRDAGWTYLVATHLGTACLLAMFVLLGRGADPLDFAAFGKASTPGWIFLLALVGFGTKAGLMPFHVWLPEAHPAAPSHVSAVMSGVMIKTGIYGLLRVAMLLRPLPAWCGTLLVGVGGATAVLGILSALAQQDVKRLLAYSSVENVGIIALALGLGLVGLHAGAADVAVLGFAAALFHVLNHATMKGLLFLGAGTVVQQTGTRRLEVLGGLLRRLPRTGAAYLVGSAAIAGLPPLNGFASEFVLYLAAYRAIAALGGAHALPAVAAIAALALAGGLAAACFAKVFGIAFLGTPRQDAARGAREPELAMQATVCGLAAGCIVLGALAPVVVRALEPAIAELTALSGDTVRGQVGAAVAALRMVSAAAFVLLGLAGAIAVWRRRLLAARLVGESPTWDCGYALPSARMQYTASSFGQPLLAVFGPVLPTRSEGVPPTGFFPGAASFSSATLDLGRERLYAPVFRTIGRSLARFRWLQHGQVQLYVLYVALTLVGLLLWNVVRR